MLYTFNFWYQMIISSSRYERYIKGEHKIYFFELQKYNSGDLNQCGV